MFSSKPILLLWKDRNQTMYYPNKMKYAYNRLHTQHSLQKKLLFAFTCGTDNFQFVVGNVYIELIQLFSKQQAGSCMFY
jgi:hypothetical protein